MNTVKLYEYNETFVLQVSPTLQYHILNGAVVKSNIDVSQLKETPFDISVQLHMANAIACASELVINIETLNVLMALIQEKIEDFD